MGPITHKKRKLESTTTKVSKRNDKVSKKAKRDAPKPKPEPELAESSDEEVAEKSEVEDEVRSYVEGVLAEATLRPADPSRWTARDGRRGIHSRPMGYLLAEMQHIARSHPGATW